MKNIPLHTASEAWAKIFMKLNKIETFFPKNLRAEFFMSCEKKLFFVLSTSKSSRTGALGVAEMFFVLFIVSRF
jgi:hypothetical protein